MSHSWLPSGMDRFWVMILVRTRRSTSSSFRSSARSRSITFRRTSLRSCSNSTPGAASRAFRITCDRCVIFSWDSFMRPRVSQDQLPFADQLVLDHLEHVVVLDAAPGHLVGVGAQNLPHLLVQPILD